MINHNTFRRTTEEGFCAGKVAGFLHGKDESSMSLFPRRPDGQPYVQPSAEDLDVYLVTCGDPNCETTVPLRVSEPDKKLIADFGAVPLAESIVCDSIIEPQILAAGCE